MRLSLKHPFFGPLILGFWLFSCRWVAAQENLSVLNYWKYYHGQPAALYHHLCEQAFGHLAERRKTIQSLKTKQDWQKRQLDVRKKLLTLLGPFPEKTPLNPQITGTLERNGIRVEKLYFESLPGYYVTAALFMPAARTGKIPAILYACGHSANGFRSRAYQQLILNYVKKGFAVLTFDPIGQGERSQYLNPDSTQRLGPTHEHSYPGAQAFVAGISPARYFIWDAIRALDYLVSRPEIDAARIGAAGRSGGGTQTAYLMALDNRVLAAAPEAYLTSFDKLLRSNGPQDAEQNLMGFLASSLDMADFVEARAPKPTLMVTTTRDIFSIEGARETYREAQRAYNLLGADNSLTMVEDDAEHASTKKNREAAYAFFQEQLRNPGSPTDETVTPFSDQDLQVTTTGNVYTSLKGETLFSLINKRITRQAQPNPARPVQVEPLRRQVMASTGFAAPTLNDIIFSGKYSRPGYDIEKYIINGPGRYYVPILWYKPNTRSRNVLLYIHDKGKADVAKDPQRIEQFLQTGYEVVLPDLSGAGELAKTYLPGGDSFIDSTSLNLWYTGILTRKSLVGVRMAEIQLVTELIKKAVSDASIIAVGTGVFCADLLHAAMATNQFERLALLNGLVSYRSLIETKHYQTRFMPSVVAGALPHYDLPDLVTALAVRPLLLVDMVDATGQPVQSTTLNQHYVTPVNTRLQVRSATSPQTQLDTLLDWLTHK